jgi:1,4-alpha-glucan branching enzyme
MRRLSFEERTAGGLGADGASYRAIGSKEIAALRGAWEGSSRLMTDGKPMPLSSFDQFLFGKGEHWELYGKLGAHPVGRPASSVPEKGVVFGVWAPNATSVQVIGDFNRWTGDLATLQPVGSTGIWWGIVPEARRGDRYKYRIQAPNGQVLDKADPMAFSSELPPGTASIVEGLQPFTWQDEEWLERRRERQGLDRPLSIYEVHLGSWQQESGRPSGWLDYPTLAERLVAYCLEMGFTHLELLPISEHPFTGSWGYQTTGYYSPTSRYGTPQQFKQFVDHCHRHGIGVLIDWVPAHFPRDGHGLRQFDGTALYEHEDPRQGEHPDWGTLIFNYGRNEVCNFLIANALYWMEQFHIDGLRVDAVASMLYLDYSRRQGEWIPNRYGGRENLEAIAFLKKLNSVIAARHPGVLTIAEESTAWPGVTRPVDEGGLGFGLKWNMGWMNDTLSYFRKDPIHRRFHHDSLTFSMMYHHSERFLLPFSHDEVVHGKGTLLAQMPGDRWQKFANLRLLLAYQWTHPGKKLLFMGNELAGWNEWSESRPLEWDLLQWAPHRGIQRLVCDLNRLLVEYPQLSRGDYDPRGFEWVDCSDRQESLVSYLRRADEGGEPLLVVCNFTPVVRHRKVPVPRPGVYRELLNTDSEYYGGSNVGNSTSGLAQPTGGNGQAMLDLTVPPLAALVFQWRSNLPELGEGQEATAASNSSAASGTVMADRSRVSPEAT